MLTAARHKAVGLPAAAHPDATTSAAAYPQPPETRPGPTAAHCHHAVSATRYTHAHTHSHDPADMAYTRGPHPLLRVMAVKLISL